MIRCIPHKIPSMDTLNLPPVLASLVLETRGLVLMVGATGNGKSTTLASMIEWRNTQLSGHILTIEEPIEFLFSNKSSIINQREVGRDTASLQIALKNALRQAPDCILIGEIRDRETMTMAISYALSGHLVLATLHANNSSHALGRILSFYTPEARPALLVDLAAALQGHRLAAPDALDAPAAACPAVEVLLNSRFIAELIEKGDMSGRQRSDGQVAGRRLADLRGRHRAPDRPGPGHAGGRPAGRRFAHQPAVAPAERHGAGLARAAAPRSRIRRRRRSPRSRSTCARKRPTLPASVGRQRLQRRHNRPV